MRQPGGYLTVSNGDLRVMKICPHSWKRRREASHVRLPRKQGPQRCDSRWTASGYHNSTPAQRRVKHLDVLKLRDKVYTVEV